MNRRRGFTLVELLVVIGIIAVLVSILLPTFAAVRRHANATKCMANLRTLGQAMSLYTQQTGFYPPAGAELGFQGHAVAVWCTELRMYLNGQRQPFRCPERDERFDWSASPLNAVAPAPPEFGVFGYAAGEPLLDLVWTPFSYGYNAGGGGPLGHSAGLSGFDSTAQRNVLFTTSQVRAAEDMIAIADSSGFDFMLGTFDLLLWPRQDGAYGLPGAVHFGGPNVLFCDGHVEWFLQQDITLPPHPDWANPAVQRVVRKWNRFHDS